MKEITPILINEAVWALIPQKSPIEMVDKLWNHNETSTTSGLLIKDKNIFSENGFFKEPGIVENIAQTAALHVGYAVYLLEKKGEKITPPIGFIGAIKRLLIHSLPMVGEELRTTIEITHNVFDVTLIKGTSFCNDKTVAECEMKIVLVKN